MEQIDTGNKDVVKMVVGRALGSFVALGLLFFLPAGTFHYWQAWVYIGIIFVLMSFVFAYFLKVDPDFLIRRMKFREKEKEQKLIIKLSYFPFIIAFIIPGLDIRFGWSHVSTAVVLVADTLVILSYLIIFFVFRENHYASRIVEVSQDQKVIDSGPYAVIRHPMYIGTSIMYIVSPLALGSYWAVLPILLIIPVIIARIISEEKILARDLPGYVEYMEKTQYRLIPGIW